MITGDSSGPHDWRGTECGLYPMRAAACLRAHWVSSSRLCEQLSCPGFLLVLAPLSCLHLRATTATRWSHHGGGGVAHCGKLEAGILALWHRASSIACHQQAEWHRQMIYHMTGFRAERAREMPRQASSAQTTHTFAKYSLGGFVTFSKKTWALFIDVVLELLVLQVWPMFNISLRMFPRLIISMLSTFLSAYYKTILEIIISILGTNKKGNKCYHVISLRFV